MKNWFKKDAYVLLFRLMHWKETGGVEKLFALPGKPLPSRSLFDSYQNHLVSHPTENEEFGLLGDSEIDTIQLENVAGAIETEDPRTIAGPKKPGRKRKEPPTGQDDAAPEQQPQVTPPVKRSSRLAGQAQKENVPPTDPHDPQGGQLQQSGAAPGGMSAEEAVFGPADPQTPAPHQQTTSGLENLGYDQTNPNQTELANFGYEQGAPTPGGVSMGAATPYR